MRTTQFMSKNASLNYDEKTQTMFITYQGEVSASSILRVHSWMREIVSQFGVKNIRGTVVDLRGVAKFPANSLTTLQVTGSDGRREYDFCALPAAIVVRNAYQETLMFLECETDDASNVQTVYDTKSAKVFITNCYEQNKPSGIFSVPALFGSQMTVARA